MFAHRYDSEEDRIVERLQNAQRARQIAKEASRQLDALHTYRQLKAATAAASRPTREGTETEPMYAGQHTKDTQKDLASLLKHEALWTVLDACDPCTKPNASLTYHDIPWPPFDDFKQYLTLMADILQQNGEKSRIGDALRKAYAKACLRWHPDKFQHRLGRGVEVDDLPSVMEKVQEIAQGINRAWSELKHHSLS